MTQIKRTENRATGLDVDYAWSIIRNGMNCIGAMFEWKHENKSHISLMVGVEAPTLQRLVDMAEQLGAAMFIGSTFTKNEMVETSRNCTFPIVADHPLIYLHPANDAALRLLSGFKTNWFDDIKMAALNEKMHDPSYDISSVPEPVVSGRARAKIEQTYVDDLFTRAWRQKGAA